MTTIVNRECLSQPLSRSTATRTTGRHIPATMAVHITTTRLSSPVAIRSRTPPICIDQDRAAVDHHGEHGTHLGHGGHGDHAAQFRDRFWLSLVLTIPVVIFSGMVADLLGYRLPDFVGADWIPPVLGIVIFLYGERRSSPARGRS
jgi:hypothetical protein